MFGAIDAICTPFYLKVGGFSAANPVMVYYSDSSVRPLSLYFLVTVSTPLLAATTNFCVFLLVILIVLAGHFLWLTILYGTALMLSVFALQDSFGTACNVTGDGALTLILTGYAEKHNIQEAEN